MTSTGNHFYIQNGACNPANSISIWEFWGPAWLALRVLQRHWRWESGSGQEWGFLHGHPVVTGFPVMVASASSRS